MNSDKPFTHPALIIYDRLGCTYVRRHHQTGLNLLVGQILRRAIATDPDTGEPVVDTTQINLQAPWR